MRNTYLQPTKPSVFANSFLLFIGLLTSFFGVGQTTVTINTPGSSSWVVPCGVTEIQVQLWGAGGAGGGATSNNNSGGGGGSGCYGFFTIPVTEGASIPYTVGAGGAGVTGGTGQDGGSTVFGPHTVGGGFGGVVNTFTPGNGCSTGPVDGNPGIAGTSSIGGSGGAAPNGGAGGAGTATITGGSGASPGGGGGGAIRVGSNNGTGGAGGNGQIIIFYEAPFSAGSGQALAACETTTTLNALALPAGYVGTWSVSPAGPVIDSPNANNSSVSNLTLNETYTFTWTVTSDPAGGCLAVTDQVIVVTQSMEINAGLDQNFCYTEFTMNANTPVAPATGVWTLVSGSATITDPSDPQTTVTGIAQGTCATLRWTITDGPCVGSDDVVVCRPASTASCNDDPCAAIDLTVNSTCVTTSGSFAGSTSTQNPGQPGCGGYDFYGGNKIDVWYTAMSDADGNLNLSIGGQTDLQAALYYGNCTDLTQHSCYGLNNTNPNTIQATNLPPNTLIYIRVWRRFNGGGTFTICATESLNNSTVQPGYTEICGGTFYDSGGSGSNYGNNELAVWTICPDTPGEFVSVTFNTMNTEQPFDQLTIIDGDDASDPVLVVAVPNSTSPQTYTSSHESGCLTFIFRSDYTITRPGWEAVVACVEEPAVNTYPDVCNEQNCLGGCMRTLCGLGSVDFTGDGAGIQELNFNNNGCMDTGERCANWFYINPLSAGTLTMDMYVNNGQNQDFAIWEGYAPSLDCPSVTGEQPIMCNIGPATNLGTGFNSSYSSFNSSYEDDLVITQQQIDDGVYFIMMVQTFSNGASCPQPTVDITFGGDVDLSCEDPINPPSTLDVTLLDFNAVNKGRPNYVYWMTSSERDNDYFTIEYSEDGKRWESIATIKGAGNSTEVLGYSFNHYGYANGINYYRLKQKDYDGASETFKIVSVDNRSDRYVIRTVNTLGQEVNDNFKGIIIDQYSDGSSEKRYNY
jgi:hypothetical protein